VGGATYAFLALIAAGAAIGTRGFEPESADHRTGGRDTRYAPVW